MDLKGVEDRFPASRSEFDFAIEGFLSVMLKTSGEKTCSLHLDTAEPIGLHWIFMSFVDLFVFGETISARLIRPSMGPLGYLFSVPSLLSCFALCASV